MKLLCRIFGHQPPVYAKKGWFSPGEEYARQVTGFCIDGINRVHAIVISECPRCETRFKICRIHVPKPEEYSSGIKVFKAPPPTPTLEKTVAFGARLRR